jgi:hypothetical protein
MKDTKSLITFAADRPDIEKLKTVTLKLGFTKSETARRALRVGLLQLEKLELPGSPSREVEARP